jgi:hypothetical protein
VAAGYEQIRKWRVAHGGIQIDEASLAVAGPFPSLFVTEFTAYLEGKGADAEIVAYIRDMGREMAWVYGNWYKAQRDANPAALLRDMYDNASPVGEASTAYASVQRFIADYAQANNIPLTSETAGSPWENKVDVAA